jgi:hypothetical protein
MKAESPRHIFARMTTHDPTNFLSTAMNLAVGALKNLAVTILGRCPRLV